MKVHDNRKPIMKLLTTAVLRNKKLRHILYKDPSNGLRDWSVYLPFFMHEPAFCIIVIK